MTLSKRFGLKSVENIENIDDADTTQQLQKKPRVTEEDINPISNELH